MIFLARTRSPEEEAWSGVLADFDRYRRNDWTVAVTERADRRAALRLQAELLILLAFEVIGIARLLWN